MRCTRPGCPDPAVVWVGIDRCHQLVRLDAIVEGDGGPGLRLCDRHAARLTLPLGWHLDDRRSETMTLWTSADAERRPAGPAGQPAGTVPAEPVGTPAPKQAKRPARKGGGRVTPPKRPQAGLLPAAPPPDPPLDPAAPADDRWRPVFDRRDDLDGLLAAESPLLARAFGRRAG